MTKNIIHRLEDAAYNEVYRHLKDNKASLGEAGWYEVDKHIYTKVIKIATELRDILERHSIKR